jgi:DNA polymerase-3 subunit gamma/tau
LFLLNGIKKDSLIGYSAESFPQALVEQFKSVQIEQVLELLLQLYKNIRYSLNQRYELELFLCRLATIKQSLTKDEVLAEVRRIRDLFVKGDKTGLETATGSESPTESVASKKKIEKAIIEPSDPDDFLGEENPDAKEESASISTEPASSETIDKQFIEYIKKPKPALASALSKAKRWDLSTDKLTIIFNPKDRFSGEMATNEKELLNKLLQEFLKKTIHLEVEYNKFMDEQEQELKNDVDGRVEMVRKIFKGEVLKK